jgi:hypothetical protein
MKELTNTPEATFQIFFCLFILVAAIGYGVLAILIEILPGDGLQ